MSVLYPFCPVEESDKCMTVNGASGTISMTNLGKIVRVTNMGPAQVHVRMTATISSATQNNPVILPSATSFFTRDPNQIYVNAFSPGSAMVFICAGEGY